MARRLVEVDELGMSAEAREAASRIFGAANTPRDATTGPSGVASAASAARLSDQANGRVPWTALAVLALALAVVFHGLLYRYQMTTNEVMSIRTDRLTGRIVRCYTVAPVCGTPVIAPPIIH